MPESFGDMIAQFARTIEEHGHGVIGVFPTKDDPDQASFSYSYGLAAQGKPELLVTMLGHDQAAMVINAVVAAGVTQPGEHDKVLGGGYRVRLVPVGQTGVGLMSVARRFAPDGFEAQQVVWPDREGRFPGEDGYDEERCPQPVYAVGT